MVVSRCSNIYSQMWIICFVRIAPTFIHVACTYTRVGWRGMEMGSPYRCSTFKVMGEGTALDRGEEKFYRSETPHGIGTRAEKAFLLGSANGDPQSACPRRGSIHD